MRDGCCVHRHGKRLIRPSRTCADSRSARVCRRVQVATHSAAQAPIRLARQPRTLNLCYAVLVADVEINELSEAFCDKVVGNTIDHSDPTAIFVVAACYGPRPTPNHKVGEEEIP